MENSVLDWAKNEVELACRREQDAASGNEWAYGVACYENALKAFEVLTNVQHSGMSIQITKNILNRLIEGRPLTPIYDTDDSWEEPVWENHWQHKRMSSLFKTILPDGSIHYTDVNRFVGVDIHNGSSWHSSLIDKIMDEYFPVKMPYCPGNAIKVYIEDFLSLDGNGDFDTKGIFYAVLPDGEIFNINRFFTDRENKDWREITWETYCELRENSSDLHDSNVDILA